MRRLTIVSAVLVAGLTGCARADRMDGQSAASGNLGGLLLVLAGVVLYVAISALLTRVRASRHEGSFDLASRHVLSRSRRVHRRRRRKPDTGTDGNVSAIDSVSPTRVIAESHRDG